jgi:hypothetical protein
MLKREFAVVAKGQSKARSHKPQAQAEKNFSLQCVAGQNVTSKQNYAMDFYHHPGHDAPPNNILMVKSYSKFFPGKLRAMLDSVQALGLSHGISW